MTRDAMNNVNMLVETCSLIYIEDFALKTVKTEKQELEMIHLLCL